MAFINADVRGAFSLLHTMRHGRLPLDWSVVGSSSYVVNEPFAKRCRDILAILPDIMCGGPSSILRTRAWLVWTSGFNVRVCTWLISLQIRRWTPRDQGGGRLICVTAAEIPLF